MDFIDLFAGLGGFHLALKELGHTCVFASEIDEELRDVYEKNFGTRPAGDIRSVSIEDIPSHDILCAGFPCQPFSKAGDQQGFDCPRWGNLFDLVIKTIEHHKPDYFILENVPNIQKHDKGKTWEAILVKLRTPEWGYTVDPDGRLSPHRFGIPQIRDRIFIVGSRRGLNGFAWPKPTNRTPSLGRMLSRKPEEARPLPTHYMECLDVWQEFLDQYPADKQLPSFPIWSMEFGATYLYEDTTPHAMLKDATSLRELRKRRGSHGRPLAGLSEAYLLQTLPSHARTKQERFPRWKIHFIKQNREIYESLKPWIDEWIPKILPFASSLQKLEWNFKGGERDIWKHVLQFRASGVRVKRPTTAPSLIAMTTTQIPIVGKARETKRYMTKQECLRLQSMHRLKYLPESDSKGFKALGNAVNVELVKKITQALLPQAPRMDVPLFTHILGGDGSIEDADTSFIKATHPV